MDGWIQIGTDLDTKQFDIQIESLERKVKELENEIDSAGEMKYSSRQLEEAQIELEKTKNKLVALKEQKEKLENVDDEKISKSLKNINSHTGNIIQNIGRWALAIIGVSGAYGAIRSAMSTLSQYNKQLAADLSYIRYALAKTLEPLILGFVNIVYKLLAYVNYLAKAWFNVNLFANASSKSFQNATNNLSKANKQAEKLNKSTQGFDEMNIVQDSSSSTEGVSMPSMDLSNLEDVKIPEWLVKFKEFCQPVVDFFKEIIAKYGPVAGGIMIIVGALAGLFIIKSIISFIKNLGKAASGVSADFTGFFDSLGKATELIALLGGLALVINSITGLIDTFSQSGMTLGEVAGLLGIILGELAATFIVLMGAMTLMEPSWQSIAGAAVIFAGLAAVILSVTKLIDTFAKSGLSLNEVIGLMTTILVSVVALMGAIVLLGPGMTAGLVPFLAVVAGISAILIVMAATIPKILESCGNFINSIAPVVIALIITINECVNNTIKALGEVLPPIITSLGNAFNSIFSGIANIVNSVGNAVSNIINSIGNTIMAVFEGIRRVIQQIGDTISQVANTIIWFVNNIGPAINNFVDNVIFAITKLINFIVSGVEYIINIALAPLRGISDVLGKVGIKMNIGYVNIPRFRPRLATGGIVNLPGRGVDIGGAIAGEAGKEGVLPLTNPQAMAELGQEIGKWINVNNTLNNYMDGRLISRQLVKRNQQLAFATNGR